MYTCIYICIYIYIHIRRYRHAAGACLKCASAFFNKCDLELPRTSWPVCGSSEVYIYMAGSHVFNREAFDGRPPVREGEVHKSFGWASGPTLGGRNFTVYLFIHNTTQLSFPLCEGCGLLGPSPFYRHRTRHASLYSWEEWRTVADNGCRGVNVSDSLLVLGVYGQVSS